MTSRPRLAGKHGRILNGQKIMENVEKSRTLLTNRFQLTKKFNDDAL